MDPEIVVVGSLNLDLVASVPHHPLPGETLSATGMARHVGGKGANQAVAAALAGGRVHMVGRHGTDGFETILLDALRSKGVEISGMKPSEGEAGMAFIFVAPDGQNSIVIVPGANGRLSAEDIRASRERIASAKLVLAQLETPLASLAETLDIASGANVPVMLDPAPVQHLGPELLRAVTWLTPNETEAASLAGSAVPRDRDGLQRFAEHLLAGGPKNLLLKLGEHGVYIATADGLREHIPPFEVTAVDTTAAGDAFNGAMAVALVEGADPVEAARFAAAAAAISVTRAGAIPSLATREEIETFRRQRASSGLVA